MNDSVADGVVQAVANLAANVDHIPNRKALALGDIGRHRKSFDVFGGHAEAPIDFSGAK